MSKSKKITALAKLCVKQPKKIVKGVKCLFKYGYSGLLDNMRASANAELESKVTENTFRMMKVNDSQEEQYMFSVMMYVDNNTSPRHLKESIQSVLDQFMNNAELLIADNGVTDKKILDVFQGLSEEDYYKARTNENLSDDPSINMEQELIERVRIIHLDGDMNKTAVLNHVAEKETKGLYLVFMDGEDYLPEYALLTYYGTLDALKIQLTYGDHSYFNKSGAVVSPIAKPDWSPDLYLSCPEYIMDAFCSSKRLFLQVGGFEQMPYKMAAERLFLTMLKCVDRVGHASRSVLIKRNYKEDAQLRDFRKELRQDYLNSIYPADYATINNDEDGRGFDVRYKLPEDTLVSIIIPTKDHADDLKIAIDSVIEKTNYKNYEIIILNNNSEKEETFIYFKELEEIYDFIRVIEASYGFNWSKLNNHGIREAKGNVFVFLNNDVKVINGEWLERLAEKALRPNTGIVGGMLLYEDDTIQHAGVVVGMNQWAAHVYCGNQPECISSPFISPLYTRNVMGCTGACYAASREVLDKIGGFDERFIICGSDIELCVRAFKSGLYNVYDPKILLYHYESKSRDSYIPEVDFQMSDIGYAPYRLNGDPFYNPNLMINETTPQIDIGSYLFSYGKNVIRAGVGEIRPYTFRKSTFAEKRLNIIVPTINPQYVYAGIATALKFFETLADATGYAKRIILCEAKEDKAAVELYKDRYDFVDTMKESNSRNQIVAYNDRSKKTLSVSENDIFIFTAWWTAYTVQDAYLDERRNAGLKPKQSIYLIQDYEPGFYAWSSRYMLAESTYHPQIPQIAVFNSGWLKDFFEQKGYVFDHMLGFDATFNSVLRHYRNSIGNHLKKDKKILVYGRPGVARNAFELLAEALEKWAEMQEDAAEWEILSAGEDHDDVLLGNTGMMMHSVGKLTIEEYARLLEKTYAGISLMVSPHPSYPPLEMATYGVNVITNVYENKDLAGFSESMTSLKDISARSIALQLHEICKNYTPEVDVTVNEAYCNNQKEFQCIPDLCELLERC